MFETSVTIVGNIVTDPIHKSVGEQELVKFRVASNSRRKTSDGTWDTGDSLYVTVNCWGRLVAGTSAALVKGDPVVVVGHLYTSEYDDREGNRRSSTEVRATSVGPDLARSIVRIDRTRQQPQQPPADVGDEPGDVTGDLDALDDADDADDADGLSLTA